MKSILMIDCPANLAELLALKFAEDKIEVNVAQGKSDSVTRMISTLPDLAIAYINRDETEKSIIEWLTRIHSDINASRTPIIAIGASRDVHEITDFAKLGVRKFFVTPIKFDTFFYYIENILQMRFVIDRTQGIVNFHINNNMLFIELGKAINRVKIAILRYIVSTAIDSLALQMPLILLVIENMDLTYVDGINIEYILDTLIKTKNVLTKNIKVITNNSFVKELIEGHDEYSSVEVLPSARSALTAVENSDKVFALRTKDSERPPMAADASIEEQVLNKILLATNKGFVPDVDLRFSFDDTKSFTLPFIHSKAGKTTAPVYNEARRVAILASNNAILDEFSAAFRTHGFLPDTFNDGALFMGIMQAKNGVANITRDKKYDLVVVDIVMKSFGGFASLSKLALLPLRPVIFVYTNSVPREVVVKAISVGANQYFVRPQTPLDVVEKAVAIYSQKAAG